MRSCRMIQRIQVDSAGKITTHIAMFIAKPKWRWYVFKFHNDKCQLLIAKNEEMSPVPWEEEQGDILNLFVTLALYDEARWDGSKIKIHEYEQEYIEYIPALIMAIFPLIIYIAVKSTFTIRFNCAFLIIIFWTIMLFVSAGSEFACGNQMIMKKHPYFNIGCVVGLLMTIKLYFRN